MIDIENLGEAYSQGSFCLYYKIANLGLKLLLRQSRGYGTYSFKQNIKRGLMELRFMKFAFDLGLAPRPYGLLVIGSGRYHRIGILVEHINGYNTEHETADYLMSKLKKLGLHHTDLHEHNVIKNKNGELKIIDFTPQFCKFI